MYGPEEAVSIGEFLIPTDPADLTNCDSCQ